LDRNVLASILSATEGEDERKTQTIFHVLAISSLILGVRKHDTVTKKTHDRHGGIHVAPWYRDPYEIS
jgi:hypothetical protein